MKVLTYNIHGWRAPGPGSGEVFNLETLVQVIGDAGADLVGLNEVFHPRPAEGGAALELLSRRLGMRYAFGLTVPSDRSPLGIPYGNAFLSRWPILAHAAHHLPAGTDGECRGLLEVRVLLPGGRPFTCYVTHLDHRKEALRVAQWSAASTWLARDRRSPHLVMGDFNALADGDYGDDAAMAKLREQRKAEGWPPPAFEVVAQALKAGYIDAFARRGAGASATFPADAPHMRIDYIFLPEVWTDALVSCRRWEHPRAPSASDHLPVLAEFA